ncbi:MAG: protein kinase domain-containing protein, partial [Planctomycetota bacterium]
AATLQTDVGQLVGTVQYMSPEQFDADPNDLDIRSDVYALGVVLYELLAGAPPYDLRKKPIHEAARIVREEDPARIAGLPNELNIVVSKALAKDRTQRYGSAAELSQDIERWLDGEPIAARAPGLVASMRRLVRRHRALSAAVASAFVVMAIALVVTVHLWRDAQRGWAEAERREQALKESIAAREQAEQTTKAAVQARQAADLGMLEARYAKAIGTGMAALARGDAAEVRRARRELDDLHQAGLADPSGRIETRLLAAFPAAEMRSLPLGVGQTNALVGTLDATSFLALGQSGVAFVNTGATGAPNAVPVTGPTTAAFSPDAQRLAVALGDGSMLLVQAPPQRADGSRDWKAAFTVARRLAGHAGAVRAIAWSPDGAVLASGDVTGAIRMWSGTDGAPLRSVQSGARSLRALGFTRDGASLFRVSSDGAMQRWNPANGTALAPAASIGKPVSAVARESGSDRVAIALDDGSVEIWQAGTLTRQSTTQATGRPAAIAFDADRLIAA